MKLAQARTYFLAFGVVLLILAILGGIQASWISLAAGGTSGVLVLIGAWLSKQHPKPALIFLLVLSALLAGRFLPLFLSTQALYPSGIIGILSLIGAVLAALALFRKSA